MCARPIASKVAFRPRSALRLYTHYSAVHIARIACGVGGQMWSLVGRLVTAAIVTLLTAAIIATMQGWISEGARDWLVQLWSPLAGFVAAYYELFERIGKVLAPFVAVGSGGMRSIRSGTTPAEISICAYRNF